MTNLPAKPEPKETDEMFYIYCIRNEENGKAYIGKTGNPRKRWGYHKRKARQDSEFVIHRAIRKYGSDTFSFKVIAEADDEDGAYKLEEGLISVFGTYETGYNMTTGGDSGPVMKGEDHPMYGLTGKDNPLYGQEGPCKGVTGEDHPRYGKEGVWEGVTGEDHPAYGHNVPEEEIERRRQSFLGENNVLSSISDETAAEIKFLEKETVLEWSEIVDIFGEDVTISVLKSVLYGWPHVKAKEPSWWTGEFENSVYTNLKKNRKRACHILWELQNTEKEYPEIAKSYDVSGRSVGEINNDSHSDMRAVRPPTRTGFFEDDTYPYLQEGRKRACHILWEVRNTNKSQSKIAEEYRNDNWNTNQAHVSNIKTGKLHSDMQPVELEQ